MYEIKGKIVKNLGERDYVTLNKIKKIVTPNNNNMEIIISLANNFKNRLLCRLYILLKQIIGFCVEGIIESRVVNDVNRM